MARYDYFRNSTHADSISTQQTIHLIFGRRFISWALVGQIYALYNLDALLACYVARSFQKGAVVGFRHIRKARPRRDVWAVERVFRLEVDMVCNQHQVADFKIGICTA